VLQRLDGQDVEFDSDFTLDLYSTAQIYNPRKQKEVSGVLERILNGTAHI
jgi:hypothetical protein